MSPEKILVINTGWEQRPLVERLLERDLDVVGVHFEENELLKELDDYKISELRDLSSILSFARKHEPEAVISDQCDYSYFASTVVANDLNLPGSDLKKAQYATNKYLQRKAISNTGILQPEFHICLNLDDCKQAMNEIGLPVIVKPVDNRGSFGVNRVSDPDTIKDAYYNALCHSHTRRVLVESFIEGEHVTVDGYCFPHRGHKSLTLATKEMLGGQRQVAVDIIYPGEISESLYDHVQTTNQKVVDQLGFSFGMTHAEYMVTDDGRCYLIEIANRGGGCFTSTYMVPAISGIDVTEQLILDCLGVDRDLYAESGGPCHRSAYLSFFTFEPGTIQDIQGLEPIESMEGVEAVRLNVNIGETIEPTRTDADRHGFIITSGDDRAESRRIADKAHETLEVIYES